MLKATLAYVYLALLAVCVTFVGWASANFIDGIMSIPVGVAAAACAFQALRGSTGRWMGAAVNTP